jgi:hypothetical protein
MLLQLLGVQDVDDVMEKYTDADGNWTITRLGWAGRRGRVPPRRRPCRRPGLMAVTAESLRLQAALDAQVEAVTDRQTRSLTAAWVLAWAEVSGDLRDTLTEVLAAQRTDTVTRAYMLRSVRLRGMLQVIAEELAVLAERAGVTITSDLGQVVADAAAAQREILISQLPGLIDATRPSHRRPTRRPGARGDRPARHHQITSRLRPLAPVAYDAVRRELIRGVAVGSNPRDTAARMVTRANGHFDGGLTRALVISRTETLDAHRVAAEQSQNLHTDVLAGWSGSATSPRGPAPRAWPSTAPAPADRSRAPRPPAGPLHPAAEGQAVGRPRVRRRRSLTTWSRRARLVRRTTRSRPGRDPRPHPPRPTQRRRHHVGRPDHAAYDAGVARLVGRDPAASADRRRKQGPRGVLSVVVPDRPAPLQT